METFVTFNILWKIFPYDQTPEGSRLSQCVLCIFLISQGLSFIFSLLLIIEIKTVKKDIELITVSKVIQRDVDLCVLPVRQSSTL